MKKYLLIGGGLLAIIAVVAAALLNSPETETPTSASKTTVSSSTAETPVDAIDQEKSAGSDSTSRAENDDSKSADTIDKKPVYIDFSREKFKARSGMNRVLLFYNTTHAPSIKLDSLLRAHIAEFPDNIAIFKVLMEDEKELADSLAVTSPGTALKYDEKNNLVGIYIANDAPDIVTFRAALQLSK